MHFFNKLKRRYSDLRWGYSQVGVIIGLSNFLLLAYNFTNAKELTSFPIFVSLTAVGFGLSLILIGHVFKKQQMSTDHDIGFEHSPVIAKAYRLILQQLPQTEETMQFVKYLKKIEARSF